MRIFVASMLAVVCALCAPVEELHAAPVSDCVVIISIDGMPGFALTDTNADIPVIRELAQKGASCQHMVASLPTMTWPNHTTLVTGVTPARHAVIGNSYWNRADDKVYKLIPDISFNKDEIVKAPTIYDIAHQSGLKTAGINWPASRGADTLDWRTPDVHTDALMQQYSTPSLLAELRTEGIPYEKQELWCKTDKGRDRDLLYTRILTHVLAKHRPNIALIHLVELDHVEHAKGPRSKETYEALKFEDERVKEIRDVLEKTYGQKATIIVTSDHGFVAVRKRIFSNVILRKAGLIELNGGKMGKRKAFAVDQGGSTFIYIVDQQNRQAIRRQIAKAFAGVEGVDRVLEPNDFKHQGLPTPEQDPHIADLVITAKDGYVFNDRADGDLTVSPNAETVFGAHGHSPEIPDMHAIFIASGNGIRPGTILQKMENRDVAPTAAMLLGLKMKNVDGRVLKSALAP
jgi:predicted AlkP superfamily pyrophosphatase or phosphodiesterase